MHFQYEILHWIFLQLYEFHKKEIPDGDDDKEEFATKLMKYSVSLQQYQTALSLDNITTYVSAYICIYIYIVQRSRD